MIRMKKIPQRQCVGCGQVKDKKSLIRVVRTPEGVITMDLSGRMNGRGAYVCRDPECLKKAVKNHGLERTLKSPVPETVVPQLVEEMTAVETG